MTDHSRERRLLTLLDAVADLSPAERAAYLDVHCADEPELKQEVERILQNERQETQQMAATAAPQTDQSAGREVGPFVLLKKLGEGGMGAVHLARHKRLDMKVAVKFIKYGRFATEMEKQRFAIEQKSLSHLSHPNIVKIFDAGLLDDGQPYYAMEFIEGVPLTTYSTLKHLSIEKRIALFIQICDAVQHAHQKLVVHRDLKPNNILIQQDGTVKLLDFGIAKLLQEGDPHLTSENARVMTLEYAAPEQIAGEEISVGTDIYSLGVILYELLTEQRPFSRDDYSNVDLAQAILHKAPPRPSFIASQKSTSQPLALEGDLDVIILKALQKDPLRRYRSARELAEDLTRFLNGHPVQARPDSMVYRMGKFVRRHRGGVATGLAVFAMLLVTGILYLINITQARQEAETALERAERVRTFTAGLFKPADPNIAQGDTLTAIEILDRGRDRIRAELQEEPEVMAEMLDVIGEIYAGLGQYDAAIDMLKSSVEQRRNFADQHPDDLSESLKHLAGVYLQLNKSDDARALLEEAFIYADEIDPVEKASMLDMMGHVAYLDARYDDAESYFRQSIDHFDDIQTPSNPKLYKEGMASALLNLGSILYAAKEALDEAELYLVRANEIYEDLHRDSLHTNLIYVNNALAEVNRGKKNFDVAQQHYRRGLTISRQLLGPHPLTATMASNLSVVLQQQGCSPESRALLEEVLDIRRQLLPPTHRSMAITYHNLAGDILACDEDVNDALPLFEQAIAIFEQSTDANDLFRARSYHQMAEAQRKVNAHETALAYARKAMAIRENKAEGANASLGRSYASMGFIHRDLAHPDSAAFYFQRGMDQFEGSESTDLQDYKLVSDALAALRADQ